VRDLLFKYTTNDSRFLVVDHTLIHYRDQGTGPVIVMLHGAFSSLHTFNDWARMLKKSYRIIRLDLIGFGLTGPNHEGVYDMNTHMRYLKSFLEILDIQEFVLVGNSLGGWLSWEFTLRYPQRVKKLVLIDAAGFLDESNMPLPFKLARAPLFGRVAKYIVQRNILEQFVKQVYYNRDKVTPELIDRYHDLFNREGNTDAFVALVNARYKDNTRKLKDIGCPTLIMWGKQDNWIPLDNAYLFHRAIPISDLVIYDECGHLPMEEIPDRSMVDLLHFLESDGLHSHDISNANNAHVS
jgi:pimeloyl-ACP methyl ester carboxylesterase